MLGDGTTFEGEAIGAAPPGGVATGEVVFNTVLSGYQEVITDPSYAGQVIAFTYPHIGNYGVSPDDHESRRPALPRAWSCASWPGGRRAGGRSTTSAPGSPATACPASRASTPGASPATSARRAPCRARSGPSARRRRRRRRAHPEAGGRGRARHRRRRPRRDRHRDVPQPSTRVGAEREPAARRRLRLRHQDDHPPPPRADRHRRGGARVDDGRRGARPRAPTACSSRTAPATRPR